MKEFTVIMCYIAITYKTLCRKLFYAHLSRIVSNKILRVFSPGKFLQKKSATWKVFVFSASDVDDDDKDLDDDQ